MQEWIVLLCVVVAKLAELARLAPFVAQTVDRIESRVCTIAFGIITSIAKLIDKDRRGNRNLAVEKIFICANHSYFRTERNVAKEIILVDNDTIDEEHFCRCRKHGFEEPLFRSLFHNDRLWCRCFFGGFLLLRCSWRAQGEEQKPYNDVSNLHIR